MAGREERVEKYLFIKRMFFKEGFPIPAWSFFLLLLVPKSSSQPEAVTLGALVWCFAPAQGFLEPLAALWVILRPAETKRHSAKGS